MKTINLDKLLAELERKTEALKLAPVSLVAKTIRLAAAVDARPLDKVLAFVVVRDLMGGIQRGGRIPISILWASEDVVGFCEAVIFYYMLKGANLEHDIVNHEQLNVIMEVLK